MIAMVGVVSFSVYSFVGSFPHFRGFVLGHGLRRILFPGFMMSPHIFGICFFVAGHHTREVPLPAW
jgi:hypothetical protein